MRKVFAMLAVAGLVAAPAMADLSGWTPSQDWSNMPIFTAQAVAPAEGDIQPVTRANSVTYDGLGPGTFGFAAFPGASGIIGYDDFVTNSGVALMTDFYFVGGVAATGQMINFYFLNSALTSTVNAFSITFSMGGNFIYTIGGFPTSASTSTFVIPHTGYLLAVAPAGSIGRWFLTSPDAVVVGSNNPLVGGYQGTSGGVTTLALVHAFALGGVPEPATLGLLVAAGAVFFVRRRK